MLGDSVKNLPSISHTLYGISDRFGIKLLTKISVRFSYLGEHRFNRNFYLQLAFGTVTMRGLFMLPVL